MTMETAEEKKAKPRVLNPPAKGTVVSSTPAPALPSGGDQTRIIAPKRKRVETEEPAPNPKRRQVASEILSGKKRAKPPVLTSPAKATAVSSTPAPPPPKGYRPWVIAPKRIRVEYGESASDLKRRQVEPKILSGSGLSMTMETTEKRRAKPRVLTSPAESTAIPSTPAPPLPSRGDQTRIIAPKRKRVETEDPAPNPKRRQVQVSGLRPAMTKEENKAKHSDLTPQAKGTPISSSAAPAPALRKDQTRAIAPKQKRVETKEPIPPPKQKPVEPETCSGQKITAPKCKRGETDELATSSRKTTAKKRRARTGVERFIFSLVSKSIGSTSRGMMDLLIK